MNREENSRTNGNQNQNREPRAHHSIRVAGAKLPLRYT